MVCFHPTWSLQTRPRRSGIDCDDIRLNLVDVHGVQNGQRHLPPARARKGWPSYPGNVPGKTYLHMRGERHQRWENQQKHSVGTKFWSIQVLVVKSRAPGTFKSCLSSMELMAALNAMASTWIVCFKAACSNLSAGESPWFQKSDDPGFICFFLRILGEYQWIEGNIYGKARLHDRLDRDLYVIQLKKIVSIIHVQLQTLELNLYSLFIFHIAHTQYIVITNTWYIYIYI